LFFFLIPPSCHFWLGECVATNPERRLQRKVKKAKA